MTPVIQVCGLTYAYRRRSDQPALNGVNLEIQNGEFLAIAGRAGAGKSTLCYALNGLIPHSFGGRMEGTVSVCDLNTRHATVAALARHVGFVMQNAESQLIGLTVEEDIAFGLENLGLPPQEIRQRMRDVLSTVGLDVDPGRSPWRLSGGQKQRLAIAAAIAIRPRVLVLDNPTAELDPAGKQEVMATLARLNTQNGTTIIVVNQELDEVLPYASRLVLMSHGQILVAGRPSDVLASVETGDSAGIRLPDLARAAVELRKIRKWSGPIPMSVEEAADQFRRLHPPRQTSEPPQRGLSAGLREPVLRVENASFSYSDGRKILHSICLSVKQGEFVALMGQNGAGKTTLAKHLNGLLVPTEGRVWIKGFDTRTTRVSKLARFVGYVFQNPDHQLFAHSVEEELRFGPRNLGWTERDCDLAVRRGLQQIGHPQQAGEDPFFMGSAERKLVSIASVLAMGPSVLVLDEPATGADHHASLQVMNYLKELHRDGLTIIVVTHDVSLAAHYADRILVMRAGSIVLDGTPREVFQKTDELRSCAIDPPAVALLSQHLGLRSFTCRVDELVQQFSGEV